jgi:hypothetical protein
MTMRAYGSGSARQARKPSALRSTGSTWAWRKTRKRILIRDRYTCQYCGAKGANTVDHKLPRSMGGGDEDSNLVACCSLCQNATDRSDTKLVQNAGMLRGQRAGQSGPVFKGGQRADMRLSPIYLPDSGSTVVTRDYTRRKDA